MKVGYVLLSVVVAVTLMAILELIRQSVIELVQSEPYAPIYVKARS